MNLFICLVFICIYVRTSVIKIYIAKQSKNYFQFVCCFSVLRLDFFFASSSVLKYASLRPLSLPFSETHANSWKPRKLNQGIQSSLIFFYFLNLQHSICRPDRDIPFHAYISSLPVISHFMHIFHPCLQQSLASVSLYESYHQKNQLTNSTILLWINKKRLTISKPYPMETVLFILQSLRYSKIKWTTGGMINKQKIK